MALKKQAGLRQSAALIPQPDHEADRPTSQRREMNPEPQISRQGGGLAALPLVPASAALAFWSAAVLRRF